MKKALIVIDLQKDYFSDGAYPQEHAQAVVAPTLQIIEEFQRERALVIFVKHASESGLLVKETVGGELHDALKPYCDAATVVVKAHADSFLNTTLDEVLIAHEIERLYLTGMMTQNCVAHTALSKSAEKYDVTVIADACAAPTDTIHRIAIRALSDRVTVINALDIAM